MIVFDFDFFYDYIYIRDYDCLIDYCVRLKIYETINLLLTYKTSIYTFDFIY
jgi:hypothetical protein